MNDAPEEVHYVGGIRRDEGPLVDALFALQDVNFDLEAETFPDDVFGLIVPEDFAFAGRG